MDRADGRDRHILRVDIARDDALQGGDKGGRGEHRIDGAVRFGAVAALADDLDHRLIDRGHGGAANEAELSRGNTRPVVQPEDRIDRKPFEQAFRDHLAGAKRRFPQRAGKSAATCR